MGYLRGGSSVLMLLIGGVVCTASSPGLGYISARPSLVMQQQPHHKPPGAPPLSRRAAISLLAAGGLSLSLPSPADSAPPAPASSGGTLTAAAGGGVAAVGGGGKGKEKVPEDFKGLMSKATKRAVGGGVSGAAAGVLQVLSLMWLRTTMNYQYRNGGTAQDALKKLYGEGGVGRLYQGVGFALVQQPMSRFGDTAANVGAMMLLGSIAATSGLPVFVQTAVGSAAASMWRIVLMPIDAFKTTMQVKGESGIQVLQDKVKADGFGVLFEGSGATLASTFVGNYPWWATFNTLQVTIPPMDDGSLVSKLARNAAIGLAASCVSDTVSNSLRVTKTVKQTSDDRINYTQTVQRIVEKDGYQGLFGRGLKTRLITNGMQGMLFSVLWKLIDETYFKANGIK